MKSLTVIVDDRVGVLADISYLLGHSRINIEGISAAVAGGKGVVQLAVKDAARAEQVLKANQYSVVQSDILVLRLSDQPGELAKVAAMLKEARINVENVQVLSKGDGVVFDALKVDKPEAARKVLKEYLNIEA